MTTTVLREAREGDLPTAAEFWMAMFEEIGTHTAADFPPEWRRQFCSHFARRMAMQQARYFVAEVEGIVVATAAAIVRESNPLADGRQTGYILGVSVAPAFRRRGIATQLTERCVTWLQSIGCKRIRLHASPAARRLYELLGFVSSSEMELIL